MQQFSFQKLDAERSSAADDITEILRIRTMLDDSIYEFARANSMNYDDLRQCFTSSSVNQLAYEQTYDKIVSINNEMRRRASLVGMDVTVC